MPLDTSTYSLALLRLDGRRWNELRRIHTQISTQAASDGSSYLEMGNTKVLCTVIGPGDARKTGGGGGLNSKAEVKVELSIAAFSGVDRKRRGRGHKRLAEIQCQIVDALSSTLLTHLFPHSLISINLHVLSQDGSLLAACTNAATLALLDAGIPMKDYLVACSAGVTGPGPDSDPLLDLNLLEEQELAFLTVGTVGASEKVSFLALDSKIYPGRLESMLAVAVDGCKQVREVLDQVVRSHGTETLRMEAS
ncbi:MAG: Exosome non-catalytic core component [Vezdaea aestivalis]|nr:MAG: Exosome non-catalytic core component [Vezdaea aestivalis]